VLALVLALELLVLGLLLLFVQVDGGREAPPEGRVADGGHDARLAALAVGGGGARGAETVGGVGAAGTAGTAAGGVAAEAAAAAAGVGRETEGPAAGGDGFDGRCLGRMAMGSEGWRRCGGRR
jgi:hypothetical protein